MTQINQWLGCAVVCDQKIDEKKMVGWMTLFNKLLIGNRSRLNTGFNANGLITQFLRVPCKKIIANDLIIRNCIKRSQEIV